LLLRVNPLTAGEHYVGKIVTNGHAWSEDVSWLVSPLVAAVVFAVAAPVLGARFMKLRGGVAG
jgi:ABC-2 type transport system permease protein